ncbi:META domain-containing protein [Pseudoalteromonas denitrificans]|nr:META domain-containing protein [Pseudoalteromonas denitrificans]
MTKTVDGDQLKHQNFKLHTIDKKAVETIKVVNIEFIEAMRTNGFAGCNRFFGQAIIEEGKFKVDKIGMTRKSCGTDINKIETDIIDTLSTWSDITLENDILTIKGKHELMFKITSGLNKIMSK